MKGIPPNPISSYIFYLRYRAKNRRRFINFDQGYLSLVIDTACEPNVRVGSKCLITGSKLGKCTYVAGSTEIVLADIGRFCSIGPGCRVGLATHPTEFISTSPVFYSTRNQSGITYSSSDRIEEDLVVSIGHDVWIGANAMILGGITIGTGAIIAAGAVVTRDVKPYTVVGGVPASLKKSRFTGEQIELLLDSRWWEWPDAELIRLADIFLQPQQFFQHLSERQHQQAASRVSVHEDRKGLLGPRSVSP